MKLPRTAVPLIINGQTVPDSVLERELLQLSSGLEMDAPHAGGEDPALLRSRALRNVVQRTLLLQAAAARRLQVSASEVDAERRRRWQGPGNSACGKVAVDELAQELLLTRVQADLLRHVPRPARATVEQYYRQHPQRFFQPEAVEAAHILRACTTPDESTAAEAALLQAESELRQGKPFAQVANRYSDCKGVGGQVGWVARGLMVPEFEDVVFALAPGVRSGIFRSDFGLHIAIVRRRRSEGVRPFDEVRVQIAADLFAAARRTALNHLLAQMEAASSIRYVEGVSHA